MMRTRAGHVLERTLGAPRGLVAIWLAALLLSVAVGALNPNRVGVGFALVMWLSALVLTSGLYPPGGAASWFDIAFLAGLVTWVAFGLRTLLLLAGLLDRTSALALLPGYGEFSDADLAAVALAVVTWTAVVAAYRLPFGASLGRRVPDFAIRSTDATALAVIAVAFAGVGWIARVILFIKYPTPFEHLAPGTMSSSDTLLTWLTVLTTVAVGLALYLAVFLRAGRLAIVFAAVLVLAEIGAGVATGTRAVLVSTVITVVVALSIAGVLRVRPWHLVLVPIVLLLYGATWMYRTVPVDPTQAPAVGTRAGAALSAIVAAGPVGVLEAGAANFVDRYPGVEIVRQIIVMGQPARLDWGGRYILAVPLVVVPRFAWPGKPVSSLPQEFGVQYLYAPRESNVPIAVTWVGDLSLSFPFLLVPVAAMALGVALRVLNETGRRSRARAGLLAVGYITLVPIVIQSDGWIDVQIYQVVHVVVILVGAGLLIVLTRRAVAWRSERAVASG
ncbi:MAG: hypothetical protein ACJ77B_01955 [Chloroflexota bacterium]